MERQIERQVLPEEDSRMHLGMDKKGERMRDRVRRRQIEDWIRNG